MASAFGGGVSRGLPAEQPKGSNPRKRTLEQFLELNSAEIDQEVNAKRQRIQEYMNRRGQEARAQVGNQMNILLNLRESNVQLQQALQQIQLLSTGMQTGNAEVRGLKQYLFDILENVDDLFGQLESQYYQTYLNSLDESRKLEENEFLQQSADLIIGLKQMYAGNELMTGALDDISSQIQRMQQVYNQSQGQMTVDS